MQNILIFGLFLGISISILPSIFAEKTYNLAIDEHSFDLTYELTGDIIAMAIDQELTSLLIGIENSKDSLFLIDLPREMISSENDEFAVLVDGFEVDYELISKENSTVLKFFVPEGTQEIEIIGTHVIPEFPIGTTFALTLMISVGIFLTKFRQTMFK